MTAIGRITVIALDCPEPSVLAEFYSAITGWPIDDEHTDSDWLQLKSDTGASIAFQQVADYTPPTWPGQEHPQQAHLDFAVDDLDVAEAQLLAVGARKHPVQPGTSFRVYLDPVGHPFCLVLAHS